MKAMTIVKNGWVYRWAGGSFIAAWTADRIDEHVPDDMIQLPDSLNRTYTTRDDIIAVIDRAERKP